MIKADPALPFRFGITQLDPDISVEESINRADMALYAAKTSGRNCACVWDPSMKHKLDADNSAQIAITKESKRLN